MDDLERSAWLYVRNHESIYNARESLQLVISAPGTAEEVRTFGDDASAVQDGGVGVAGRQFGIHRDYRYTFVDFGGDVTRTKGSSAGWFPLTRGRCGPQGTAAR
jgi:hypothetical protein